MFEPPGLIKQDYIPFQMAPDLVQTLTICAVSRHSYTPTLTLLLVNTACSNDCVGLVGVRRLIYLVANINMGAAGSRWETNGGCVDNSLSVWVTLSLKNHTSERMWQNLLAPRRQTSAQTNLGLISG